MQTEIKNKIKNIKRDSSGFVAIFTVLIATTIMLMIVGITGTTYKETLLTRSSTDSNKAFFAADTGSECALYYDRKINAFPEIVGIAGPTILSCQNITSSIIGTGDLKYSFLLDSTDGWCSDVRVDKAFFEDGAYYTKIESFGYNTSCSERGVSPASVERAIRIKYPNAFFAL